MIDMTKQYTCNGKPVRIYADSSDTTIGYMHGAFLTTEGTWSMLTFKESDLVEVWQPKEGEIVYMWDRTAEPIVVHIRRFRCMDNERYKDTNRITFNYCAPFTGTLLEEFKGLL